MTVRDSDLYICNKNGSDVAKIGDLFLDVPGGWQRVVRQECRNSVTGQQSWRYTIAKDFPILIPMHILQPYLIQVRPGFLRSREIKQ